MVAILQPQLRLPVINSSDSKAILYNIICAHMGEMTQMQ